jgi:glutamyl-tRNA reductase
MNIVVVGMNHDTAPIEVRERIAIAQDQAEDALLDACERTGLQEIVLLSTCNRTEMCAALPSHGELTGLSPLEWLAEYHHLGLIDIQPYSYSYRDGEAFRHLVQVASGLNSMVVGEPQILGQMKSAYSVAQAAGTTGPVVDKAFQHCFAAAKKVRTDTAIGENPVSVAYAAVNLSRRVFADLAQTRALLIGAGETIELVARHLVEAGVKELVIANRTLARARAVAGQFGAEAMLLADIPDQLVNVDIVITSTASQLPILGKGMVGSAVKQRRHRPIFMVDIAVPRDIEAEVGDLADVYLYSIDDLRDIVEENRRGRKSEAGKADGIIELAVVEFLANQRSAGSVNAVKALRTKAEDLRDRELNKALAALRGGAEPEDLLKKLAHGLTNKLLHKPSVKLKQAGRDGREDVIAITRQLYDLDGQETSPEEKP